MPNPRLDVARLRLAGQQGQRHPLDAAVQGLGRGIQFVQNMLAEKQRLAESRARLRMAQEKQKQAEEQFKLQTEFLKEAEKRAKAEEMRQQQKFETEQSMVPQKRQEAAARLEQIKQMMAMNRASLERQQTEQQDVDATSRAFLAQQRMMAGPQMPPGEGGTPGPGNPPMPMPSPQTGAGAQALMRLQAPGRAAQASDLDFRRTQSLQRDQIIARIKQAAMQGEKSGGPAYRVAIEAAKSAINNIAQAKQAAAYQAQLDGRDAPSMEFTEQDFKMIQSAMRGGMKGLEAIGMAGPSGPQAAPAPAGGGLRVGGQPVAPAQPTFDESVLDKFRNGR